MAITYRTLIEERTTRHVFEKAISAWSRRDLYGLLHYVDDDVTNTINVDANVVPFAPSVYGKQAYKTKLQHILSTFNFAAYVTRHVDVSGSTARAAMMIVWVHKSSGEKLNTNFRFVVKQQDGRITRVTQYYDAAYVSSFARLISAAPALSAARCDGAADTLAPLQRPPPAQRGG
jgi:ketosteroid isomerase-like protein